jgi:4Fe-4S single cluster domain
MMASSTTISPASSAIPPLRFTYMLPGGGNGGGGTIYVPLTSRCNTRTLPSTRGPHFVLPSDVVASLCRVRDAEAQSTAQATTGTPAPLPWEPWCRWLDTVDFPQKVPASLDPVAWLKDVDDESARRPTADELWEEIRPRLQQDPSLQIVFAGEGEPLLRLSTLLRLAHSIKQESSTSTVRITTNGLVPELETRGAAATPSSDNNETIETATARSLAGAGVRSLSVALMTHDPDQYEEIMQPVLVATDNPHRRRPHDRVCDMIRAGLTAGLEVEVTAVEAPLVSRSGLERFAAESLGTTVPVRWRTYFQ